MALQGHREGSAPVIERLAPASFVVFVQGMGKWRDSLVWLECGEMFWRKVTGADRETWREGSYEFADLTVSSPSRQQPQKAQSATTQTAASKGCVRWREWERASKCSIVTGGRRGRRAEFGASFDAPCFTCETRSSSPCHAAPLKVCHARSAENQPAMGLKLAISAYGIIVGAQT